MNLGQENSAWCAVVIIVVALDFSEDVHSKTLGYEYIDQNKYHEQTFDHMSSIYRKGGTDGVYYYQAYVYNPETQKKDKRIFHSLSTRDPIQAERLQAELDVKYEEQGIPQQQRARFTFLSSHKRSIALMAITAVITVFMVNLFHSQPSQRATKNEQPVNPAVMDNKAAVVLKAEETHSTPEPPLLQDESHPVVLKTEDDQHQEPPDLSIPKHTVVRVESISSVFNQGKIYVTVDEKTSTERLRLLCKSITKRYPEFSNIVICLYASTAVGNELAKGTGIHFSEREQNKAWLVLYSYNSVEGEYFDDEPGKYLGS